MPLLPRGHLPTAMTSRLTQLMDRAFGPRRRVQPSTTPTPPRAPPSMSMLDIDEYADAPPSPADQEAEIANATSAGALSLGELRRRIEICARRRLQGRALYNGQWRNLEPTKFKYADKDDPDIPLLCAYCTKDEMIESFKLKKFQGFQVTRTPYRNPNSVLNDRGKKPGPWPVEIQ